jgi:hypothetical protein
MTTNVSKQTLAHLLLGGLVFLSGCSGSGRVSGTVTCKGNGKKLMSGTVMILGSDQIPHYGEIKEDGTYAVGGVPPGPARVTVTSPNPNETADDPSGPRGMGGRGRAPAGLPSRSPPPSNLSESAKKGWFAIPDKYADPAKTPLTVEIKGGHNAYPIELDP